MKGGLLAFNTRPFTLRFAIFRVRQTVLSPSLRKGRGGCYLAVHRGDGGRKVLLGYAGAMANAQTVVVDGLRRVVKKLGYAHAVGNSEAHEGINAQLGRKPRRGGKKRALSSGRSKASRRSTKSGWTERNHLSKEAYSEEMNGAEHPSCKTLRALPCYPATIMLADALQNLSTSLIWSDNITNESSSIALRLVSTSFIRSFVTVISSSEALRRLL